MDQVARYWNGQFGRLARRDIWLKTDGVSWRVEARRGDGDASVWGRDYLTEAAARADMAALMERTHDTWRDLIG